MLCFIPGDFESKFASLFRSCQQFPSPKTFDHEVKRIYPSENGKQCMNLHDPCCMHSSDWDSDDSIHDGELNTFSSRHSIDVVDIFYANPPSINALHNTSTRDVTDLLSNCGGVGFRNDMGPSPADQGVDNVLRCKPPRPIPPIPSVVSSGRHKASNPFSVFTESSGIESVIQGATDDKSANSRNSYNTETANRVKEITSLGARYLNNIDFESKHKSLDSCKI